jgi:hypothetical protein
VFVEALTKEKLMVSVQLSVRWHPTVSPDRQRTVNELLVQSEVRALISTLTIEQSRGCAERLKAIIIDRATETLHSLEVVDVKGMFYRH